MDQSFLQIHGLEVKCMEAPCSGRKGNTQSSPWNSISSSPAALPLSYLSFSCTFLSQSCHPKRRDVVPCAWHGPMQPADSLGLWPSKDNVEQPGWHYVSIPGLHTYYNKLKMTECYSLTVPEVCSPKSRCLRVVLSGLSLSLSRLWAEFFPASSGFCWLQILCGF